MALNKKGGDEKYYLIIGIIIGLVVIAIVMFWLFQEYFFGKEVDRESCRQSIILRANAPEQSFWIFGTHGTKDALSMKCKNEVININYQNKTRAEKEIAEAVVSCWDLVGNGAYKLFPSDTYDVVTYCMFCARVHINSSVSDYYRKSENVIDISNGLTSKFINGKSYVQYMTDINPSASPFRFNRGVGSEFVLIPQNSEKEYRDYKGDVIEGPAMILPRNFSADGGDLFIIVSNPGRSEKEVTPFLFYMQSKDFNQAFKIMASKFWIDLPLCNKVETTPV
jgi:hypothetical protein